VEPKELFQRSTDAWNARDLEGITATYTEDCELTAPGFTGKGHQGLQEFWSSYMDAFPDNQVRVGLVIVEGNNLVEESVFEGTNSGPLEGPDGTRTPATGQRVSAPFSGIYTVRDDKFASMRLYFDQLDMLTQLGISPG
jgi:predicted ester cyclase